MFMLDVMGKVSLRIKNFATNLFRNQFLNAFVIEIGRIHVLNKDIMCVLADNECAQTWLLWLILNEIWYDFFITFENTFAYDFTIVAAKSTRFHFFFDHASDESNRYILVAVNFISIMNEIQWPVDIIKKFFFKWKLLR